MPNKPLHLLRDLTQADAVPGHEAEVRAIVRRELANTGESTTDGLGNLFITKPGNAPNPRVMLDCHMDEVGFLVQRITEDGFIKFINVGGWWGHTLLGQRVTITGENGKLFGVIGASPPHLLAPEARDKVQSIDDMFIDIGAENRTQATQHFGITPGCPITPVGEWKPTAHPHRFAAKAFDNRVGVALMIQAMQQIQDHPNTIIGAACVQEEVGLRGATVAVETIKPDIAIVLEAPPADDIPGCDKDAAQGRLGHGPQIRFFDPTMIAAPALARWVTEVAEEFTIPHQRAVRRSGGTNAGAIHKSHRGIPTIVIGVPIRYIHSHTSLIDTRDYDATLQLLLKLLAWLDQPLLDSLTD